MAGLHLRRLQFRDVTGNLVTVEITSDAGGGAQLAIEAAHPHQVVITLVLDETERDDLAAMLELA